MEIEVDTVFRNFILNLLFGAVVLSHAQEPYPKWLITQHVFLEASWEYAPVIAVGRLRNVKEVGVQHLDSVPQGVDRAIKVLYWCQAELDVQLLVKGHLPPSQPKQHVLWPSRVPGCEFGREDATLTDEYIRVWLLRVEGEFLRPLYDGGAATRIVLLARDPAERRNLTKQSLGSLFLRPSAYENGVDDLKSDIMSIGSIACSLLGRQECIQELRALANRDQQMRARICEFIRASLENDCSILTR